MRGSSPISAVIAATRSGRCTPFTDFTTSPTSSRPRGNAVPERRDDGFGILALDERVVVEREQEQEGPVRQPELGAGAWPRQRDFQRRGDLDHGLRRRAADRRRRRTRVAHQISSTSVYAGSHVRGTVSSSQYQ